MKKISFFFVIAVSLIALVVNKSANTKAPFLTVVGFVKMADGLGRQCPDMIEALHQEFDVGFIPLQKIQWRDVPHSITKILKNPAKKQGTVVFFNDNPWSPVKKKKFWMLKNKKNYGALSAFETPKNKDQIRICYTMVESTLIPKPWVEVLNTYFDIVAVPDPFLEKVFADSGVEIPIFTLPLGLNLKPYLDKPLKSSFNQVFRFACMGALGERKNQITLIKAFDKAFNKDPNIELLIHSRMANKIYSEKFHTCLKELNNPMIRLENSCLDNTSYQKLFSSLDMLVNVSKGEGFSIQPREAMALGIPVLMSNNTAQKTIIDNTVSATVETPYKNPCYYSYLSLFAGDNFDCDVDELALALQKAYNNRYELLSQNEKNKNYARQFDYPQIKGLYKTLISPKKVTLGEKNILSVAGVETNSKELAEKWQRLTGAVL
jgi:glycosyltransferase involved in cell wall biosynthesis